MHKRFGLAFRKPFSIAIWLCARFTQRRHSSDPMAQNCPQCGVHMSMPPGPGTVRYLGRWMCSAECSHAAGDRSACYGWDCGCTRYAKKRRLLKAHRREMRVVEEFIHDHGLTEELEERLIEETGNVGFCLETDSEDMDEPSDKEEPDQQLRATVDALRSEAADQRAMVEAVQGALECRSGTKGSGHRDG